MPTWHTAHDCDIEDRDVTELIDQSMRKIILFFAIGAVLLFGLNLLSQAPAAARRDAEEARRAFAHIAGRAAVTLGGSIGRSIDYRQLCIDGAPFYHDAQDIFEQAALTDLILDRVARPPRYWFVTLLPSAQSADNGSQGSSRAEPRRRTYRLLFDEGRLALIDGDWRQAFVTKFAPSLGAGAWQVHADIVLRAIGVTRPISASQIAAGNRETLLDPGMAAALAADEALTQKEFLRQIAYYDPDVSKRATAALIGMNRKIRARGGTMIVVVPPVSAQLREEMNAVMPEQIREFGQILGKLEADNAIIASYWITPSIAEQAANFHDNTHLGAAGSATFSRMMAKNLRARGVLPPQTCPADDS